MVVSTPSLGNLINLKKNKPEFGEGKFMFAESLETRCSKQSGYDVFSSIKTLTKAISMPFNRNSLRQSKTLLLTTLLLTFTCCQKWDPDSQFQAEVQALKEKREQYKHIRNQEAQRNLNQYQGDVLLKIVRKLPVRELDLLLGYKYKILAQTSLQGDLWERRQYYWEDIVESKWGRVSAEYELCKKNSVLLIVSINSREVIGVEY